MSKVEYIKCPNCSWVHYIVTNGDGMDNCFLCSTDADEMVPCDAYDLPFEEGTIMGVSRGNKAKRKKLNAEKVRV